MNKGPFKMKAGKEGPMRKNFGKKLIKKIKPDILIKGGDYKANEIVGSDFVKKNNGDIKIIPFVKGCSTTNIIKKINKSSD